MLSVSVQRLQLLALTAGFALFYGPMDLMSRLKKNVTRLMMTRWKVKGSSSLLQIILRGPWTHNPSNSYWDSKNDTISPSVTHFHLFWRKWNTVTNDAKWHVKIEFYMVISCKAVRFLSKGHGVISEMKSYCVLISHWLTLYNLFSLGWQLMKKHYSL